MAIVLQLYRVYLKCLDKLQGEVREIKPKKKVHINICPEMSGFFTLIERLNLTINIHVIFYLQLTKYIYKIRFQFNNC